MENPRKQARLPEGSSLRVVVYVVAALLIRNRKQHADKSWGLLWLWWKILCDYVTNQTVVTTSFPICDVIRLHSGSAPNMSGSRVCYLPTTGCLGLLLVSSAVCICMLLLLKGIILHEATAGQLRLAWRLEAAEGKEMVNEITCCEHTSVFVQIKQISNNLLIRFRCCWAGFSFSFGAKLVSLSFTSVCYLS